MSDLSQIIKETQYISEHTEAATSRNVNFEFFLSLNTAFPDLPSILEQFKERGKIY